mgnify:CR=1 FL=1
MRKSILTLGFAAVLTGVLATCSMAYAADDKLAQIQEDMVKWKKEIWWE